ncbi:hypothetical protein KKG63_02240 [Patescibacteria group bacterium]|nr:hypothetical protein [Patescibacteria group bacterium]
MKKTGVLTKGQVRHLERALIQSNFLREDQATGETIQELILALENKFLGSEEGKGVRRVINALRTIKVESFSGITTSVDKITPQIRRSTLIFTASLRASAQKALAQKMLGKAFEEEPPPGPAVERPRVRPKILQPRRRSVPWGMPLRQSRRLG